ncbi:Serine/threonine-protein kinase haspin [Fasciola gigantica]|uniref:non-specific serine/threonine protein kinase n=1 Tax=Fasciola gigantica TaxID=46835 RepID=A0A504YZ41_FASGI|nr:Serine/threonine-protein kinase haspin [Fasciola gigantica]
METVVRHIASAISGCNLYFWKALNSLRKSDEFHESRINSAELIHPVKQKMYNLRNHAIPSSRRKRTFNQFNGLPTLPVTSRKRLKRSESVSSQKENNAPPSGRRSSWAAKPKVDPLKNVNGLTTISEHVSSSTPIRPSNLPVTRSAHAAATVGVRLTRSQSARASPFVPIITRTRRSRQGSDQPAPHAELRVQLERVPLCTRSASRSNATDASVTSSDQSSPTELLSMDASLASWFSPRRYNAVGKDQAAKLKRLNTRKMEFDLQELSQSVDREKVHITTESLMNQSMVGDPLEKLLELCGQTEVKPFTECFDEETLEGINKIGEGVYGEVFQSPKGHVIKIFPVAGDDFVNGEKQMAFADVYPEVFVSKKLSELAYKYRRNRSVNFSQMKKATVVCGSLPEAFATGWRKFKAQMGSDNECPDFLPSTQQWMVLEFEFAGEPLANIRFNTCREARSVIEQIALSLAAAESALQFEHRDLHWHNILVRPTRQWKLRYRVGGVSYAVFTEGIQVTIIDFTVSRLFHEGNIVYVDMSDSPEIFEGEGDYQFDIYRIMRDNNGNDWRPFHPRTNLYWLHYLMGKLLNETSYPRRDPDSQPVESELRALYDMVLTNNYRSATHLVSTCFYFDTCRIG